MLLCRRFIRIVFLVIFVCGSGYGMRPERADVCIIVDTSRKYGPAWKDIVRGIASMMNRMSVSPSTTRLSLLTVDSLVRLRIKLGLCTNRECFKEKLESIRHIAHPPSTAISTTIKAIKLASRILNIDGHRNAKKYILLIETWPSQNIKKFLRKTFAHLNIVLATSTVQSFRGGYFSIKLGSSFHKGKSLVPDKILPFAKGSFTKCKGSGEVLDECSRRCDCKHGRMVNCRRVRKEFTEMTLAERRRFIKAFKTLCSDLKYKRKYEKFARIHFDNFFTGIHTQNYFLPWHRWYVLAFENMIREVDCRVTIPYWDWAFWSNIPWKENFHIWNSHDYGLGGDGDPKKGYCVQDGPFKEGLFKTPGFDNKYEVLDSIAYVIGKPSLRSDAHKGKSKSGCLRRSFNAKPMGISVVKKALLHSARSFSIFEAIIRVSLHNSIHNDIGGHMCSTLASVAPEFYLHHAFLDKIWFTWQQHSISCMKAKFANSHKKMSKFKCPYSQSEMIDSSKLPGNVRVVYTDYYYGSKHSGVGKKSDSGIKLEEHKETRNGVAQGSHLDHMQGPVREPNQLLEDSEDDDENDDVDTGDRRQDFGGDKPNEGNFRFDGMLENDEDASDPMDDMGASEKDHEYFSEPINDEWHDRSVDYEGRIDGSDDWAPSTDSHSHEVAEDIDLKLVRYGETDYDFRTKYSIQSKDPSHDASDNSGNGNCEKDAAPFTKRDFIPAYEKLCYSDYVNKMLG